MAMRADFETLVEQHSAEIFTYLWRLVGAGADSEDCLQETFLRAYRAYPKLNNQSNLRAWLYRIATNTAFTYLKRRSRELAQSTDLDPNLPAADPPVPEQVERRLALSEIRRAVETLPEKQQAALLLRKYQRLSYAEIAGVLGCKESAARANVYQGLRKLRDQFSAWTDQQEDGQ